LLRSATESLSSWSFRRIGTSSLLDEYSRQQIRDQKAPPVTFGQTILPSADE
jgi:hypothetical protein